MTLQCPSMDDVLRAALRGIERHGICVAPRGMPTKEVTGFSFTLLNPRARKIANRARHWSEAYAIGELCWHLSASDRLDQIAFYSSFWTDLSADGQTIRGSCYGKRIFGVGEGVSLWAAMRGLLVEDPSTRRAVIYLTPLEHPTAREHDVPCISSIQFLIRRQSLDCYVSMRSCDVIYGLCYDVYFVTMLHEMMSLELGLKLGHYHHTATSMHYYERHTRWVRRILDERKTLSSPMPPMTDLEGISSLLRVERTIRRSPSADTRELLGSLSSYWLAFAKVLLSNTPLRKDPVP